MARLSASAWKWKTPEPRRRQAFMHDFYSCWNSARREGGAQWQPLAQVLRILQPCGKKTRKPGHVNFEKV